MKRLRTMIDTSTTAQPSELREKLWAVAQSESGLACGDELREGDLAAEWLRVHGVRVTGEAVAKGKGGRPRKHASAAERQAAYVARKGKAVTFYLDDETAAALSAYMARRVDAREGNTLTQADVLARLVRSQLLRKR